MGLRFAPRLLGSRVQDLSVTPSCLPGCKSLSFLSPQYSGLWDLMVIGWWLGGGSPGFGTEICPQSSVRSGAQCQGCRPRLADLSCLGMVRRQPVPFLPEGRITQLDIWVEASFPRSRFRMPTNPASSPKIFTQRSYSSVFSQPEVSVDWARCQGPSSRSYSSRGSSAMQTSPRNQEDQPSPGSGPWGPPLS